MDKADTLQLLPILGIRTPSQIKQPAFVSQEPSIPRSTPSALHFQLAVCRQQMRLRGREYWPSSIHQVRHSKQRTSRPNSQDGSSDVENYNEELAALGGVSWVKSPWLYLGCYMHRLIHTFLILSTNFWTNYDVFHSGKHDSFVASKKGALELVKHFMELIKSLRSGTTQDGEAQRSLFDEMMQISLWGNSSDLSLLSSLTPHDLQSRQGKAAREASKANVVADDTGKVWKFLSQQKQQGTGTGRINLVLDNAGFEFLADLVLIGYLLESGFATKVVLHGTHAVVCVRCQPKRHAGFDPRFCEWNVVW